MQKNKKYYLLTATIILCGLVFKFFIANLQPLWLDEQYSIFYATQFKSDELLANFSIDVHPGFYYFFLKNILKFTIDKTLLRTITSILPQFLGILLLGWFYFKQKKNKELILTTFILSFNPFFNHLSFQLRNYSLVFLFTIITFIYLQHWLKQRKILFLILTIGSLLMGNMIHYLMYIFSFFTLIFISLKLKALNLKKLLFFLTTTLIIIGQFFTSNGFSSPQQYKHQFEDTGWIALPSLHNIPKVYLTSLGMATDVMNTATNYRWLSSIIFYSTLLVIAFALAKQKPKINSLTQQLLILSLLPILGILLASFLLTFLSHRFFIHQFIPRISLFLPRIQLPFVILFWIFISEMTATHWINIKRKIKNKYIYSFVIILSIYWGVLNYHLNINNHLSSDIRQESIKKLLNNNHNDNLPFYLWPHWMWLEAIDLNQLEEVSAIGKLKKQSEKFEQPFNDSSSFAKCDDLGNSKVYVYASVLITQQKLQSEVIKVLSRCCAEQNQFGSFRSWNCSNN